MNAIFEREKIIKRLVTKVTTVIRTEGTMMLLNNREEIHKKQRFYLEYRTEFFFGDVSFFK